MMTFVFSKNNAFANNNAALLPELYGISLPFFKQIIRNYLSKKVIVYTIFWLKLSVRSLAFELVGSIEDVQQKSHHFFMKNDGSFEYFKAIFFRNKSSS